MKSIVGVILLLLCVNFTQAQPVVTVSKPYEVIDADQKHYFSKNNQIIAVKVDRKDGVSIQKLRTDNPAFEKIRTYNDFPKMSVVEKITEFDGKFYVFYSSWSGEQEQLFAREINFDKGEFAGPGQKILTVKQKISGDMAKAGFARLTVVNKFDFYFSHDSSRLLVQYRLVPEVKKDSKNFDVIGLGVFDRDLKAAWTKEVKMPYTEKKMNILDYVVDRKNNAYIVAMVYADDTTEEIDEEGNPNYKIEILKLAPGAKEVVTYPVNLPDKFVQTVWIYESPKGYLVGAGFYNKGKEATDADGILMFRLSEEGKLLDIATFEIPLEILNQYASAKTQRKNERKDEKEKAEFQNLVLKEVRFNKDGGMLLISEQEFRRMHSSYSQNGSSSYYTYHYNDILITKISAAGKLEWMKKLPKRQVGRAGKGGMSYKYMRGGSDHYFLFLDNEKNRDLNLNELPAAHSDGQGGFLTSYKVDDATGNVSKVYILNTRDIKGEEVHQFMASRIVATGSKEFVFEAYKRKKEDILVKVKM